MIYKSPGLVGTLPHCHCVGNKGATRRLTVMAVYGHPRMHFTCCFSQHAPHTGSATAADSLLLLNYHFLSGLNGLNVRWDLHNKRDK